MTWINLQIIMLSEKKKTDSEKKRECVLSNEILENVNKFIVTESKSGDGKR